MRGTCGVALKCQDASARLGNVSSAVVATISFNRTAIISASTAAFIERPNARFHNEEDIVDTSAPPVWRGWCSRGTGTKFRR